jgi:hypothetical protein
MCADLLKFTQALPAQLSGAGATIGDTSITLVSFTDPSGNVLAMTDFGTKGYGTIEPNNGSQQESFTFTGLTVNGNGTTTLSGVYSVLFKVPYTQSSGLTLSHPGGVNVIISNTPAFYDDLTGKNNDETVTGKWTFPGDNINRPTASVDTNSATATDFVTFGQLSRTALASAVPMTPSLTGYALLSTTALVATQPVVLGTNEVSATSGANKVVRAGSGGKIDQGFLDLTQAYTWTGTQVFTGSTAFATTVFNVIPTIPTTTPSTAGQVIGLGSTAKLPAVDASLLTNIVNQGIGVFTKDLSDASTTLTIAHGLGRVPKIFKLYCISSASVSTADTVGLISNGTYNGSTYATVYTTNSNGTTYACTSSTSLISYIQHPSNSGYQTATITTFDATNIVISWTKVNTPTGTYICRWEAM